MQARRLCGCPLYPHRDGCVLQTSRVVGVGPYHQHDDGATRVISTAHNEWVVDVEGDQLGWSISASSVGGTIVVGAPGYLGNDVANFRRDGRV